MSKWELKKIREIGKVNTGSTPKTSERNNYGDYIPFIKPANFFHDGSINYEEQSLSEIGLSKARLVKRDSILMVCIGATIGKVGFTDRDITTNQQINSLTPTSDNCAKFIYYQMLTKEFQKAVKSNAGQTTLPIINKKKWSNLLLKIPPLSEQKRIVEILDEAFEGIDRAIANTKKNLANAREIFDSYLNNIFIQKGEDWINSTIEKQISFIDYRGKTPPKTEEGLRLITAKNIRMGFIKTSPQEFVNPEIYYKWMTRGIPKKGDILFTTEAPLGNVAQLNTNEKVVFAQRIIIFQPNSNSLDTTFLKFMLLSKVMQQKIQEKGTGATAKGIKASLLKKIEISFPCSLQIQQEIAENLTQLQEETQSLEAIYQRKLEALQELKQSLLHKAFTGELTNPSTSLRNNPTVKEVAA